MLCVASPAGRAGSPWMYLRPRIGSASNASRARISSSAHPLTCDDRRRGTESRLLLIDGRGVGAAGRVNNLSTPCEGSWATPGVPEHHGEHDSESAGPHQDPADGMH